MATLREQAEGFAAELTDLLRGTVCPDAVVTAVVDEEGRFATVAPGPRQRLSEYGLVPLPTPARRVDPEPRLWLKVHYELGLDDEGEYLTVTSSAFGLCINPKTKHCPLRVEYDRSRPAHQQAHVHLDGQSLGIGFAVAAAGLPPMREMHKLHFPVGGRRYRPSVENFLEFLKEHEFICDLQPGWRQALDDGLVRWEQRQLRAAVRRSPDPAIAQLRAMGYEVRPPPGAS